VQQASDAFWERKCDDLVINEKVYRHHVRCTLHASGNCGADSQLHRWPHVVSMLDGLHHLEKCVRTSVEGKFFIFLTPLINLIRIPEFCVIFNKICFEQKNELWKRLCFDEFEMDEMSEMLSELYPFTRMINYYNDPDINWFIVYRNCKSSRLTNPCEQTSTIEINARSHINRTINCMKLSGMFVF